jgi:hypothetical protein
METAIEHSPPLARRSHRAAAANASLGVRAPVHFWNTLSALSFAFAFCLFVTINALTCDLPRQVFEFSHEL